MHDTIRSQHGRDRLEDDLRRAIAQGRLVPGDRLRPLRELMRQYDIAMNTARAAIDRLKREGLLLSRRGSGVYVSRSAPAKAAAALARPGDPSGERGSDAVAVAPSASSARPERDLGGAAAAGRIVIVGDLFGHVFGPLCQALLQRLAPDPRGVQLVDLTGRDRRHRISEHVQHWRADPPDWLVLLGNPWLAPRLEGLAPATRLAGVFWPDPASPHAPAAARRDWLAVGPDWHEVGELIVAQLVAAGHRRLALLTHARMVGPTWPENARKRIATHTPQILGLGKALRRRGLRHGLSVWYDTMTRLTHRGLDPEPHRQRRFRNKLIQPGAPTAVVGADFRLLAVHRAAADLRQPLALLGLGATPWSQGAGFDSLSFNEDAIADALADALLSRTPPAGPITTPVSLVRRGRDAPLAAPAGYADAGAGLF